MLAIAYIIIFLALLNLLRMAVFLIGADLYDMKAKTAMKAGSHGTYNPLVTVVIPAYNEGLVIKRALVSVANNSYKNFEIIVVDDGSIDNTSAIVRSYIRSQKKRKIKLIRQKNQGKSVGLNNAILKHAKGELIMILDGDSLLDRHAVRNGVKYFADKKVKALASNVRIMEDGSLISLIQKFEYLISYRMKKALTTYNLEYIIGGIGSMFRKSILVQAGGFNTKTMTEDIHLSMKIINRGNKSYRVVYGADVIALTESVMNLKGLLTQRYRWKYGRFQTWLDYKNLFFNRSKKHNRALTMAYLPTALFGEFTLLIEPFIILFFLVVGVYYQDATTILTAMLVITIYISLNVMLDDRETLKSKMRLLAITPVMYFTFFLLSFVELVALVRSIINSKTLKSNIKHGSASWKPVERSGVSI